MTSTNPNYLWLDWSGKSKPTNPNLFMRNVVDEIERLLADGLKYGESVYRVSIEWDTPARSFVKLTNRHSCYYGCDSGVDYMNRMTFPDVNVNIRTDVAFDEMTNEEHHCGESVLKELKVGVISKFPLDYMHLICLGIVKKNYGSVGPCLFDWERGFVRFYQRL